MSSLEKRHTSRRGSMQGHHKYSDGFSDTSSAGSFMDETDREVSNLTDRAFRSLCIGEEAIYNDSEISSPTERHKAFAEEVQQKEVLKTTCKETLSYGVQYGEAERQSEVTSTFQHSYVDVAQEQVLRDEHMSYMSNGSMEAAWQQRRSTSRVSSLIKAFSSREGYCDSGTPDALLLRDKYRDYNNGSWDKSALLSIQRELSEFSTYHQNFKSGPFQSYRNHFHASAAAMARMDTTTSIMTSSKTRFQALNSTNFFFHSEFSPFQLWKDYNRFPFEREEPLGFVSASDFPRWYDSPLYKELTATDTFSNERRFNRRKIEDVVPTQRSRSTVVQKAPAIEKRCESEMASNCPPWKRNNNFVRNKLPSNRPSTVSPTNTKTHRPNSSLLSYSRHTFDTQQKVESMVDTQTSNSSTPFNITQLLTPVIHGRQETETSEILQFSHTPSLPDYSVQGDVDLKSPSDVRQLRDSYKSKASSLLFNLKDNRKRVKSTYTPSKFTSLEITDRTKQPSILDDLESGFSDTSTSQATIQQYSTDSWEAGNVVQQTYEARLSQTEEHQVYSDGLHDDVTLASHYGAGNYKVSYGGSQSVSLHPDTEYDFSQHLSSAQNKSAGNSDGQIYGLSKKVSPTRPEIENNFPEATTLHPPAHSLSAQVSEKWAFSRRELGHHEFTDRQNVVRKTNYGYTTNPATEEKLGWENREPPTTGIKDSLTFKGEIAALIERDKQRKATAKQYLPSANGNYTTGKENYINKVNEDIKQGRLVKEEEDQDTEGFLQKHPYTTKPARGNPTNGPSASHLNSYEFQNNAHHKMTPSSLSSSSSLSPPKESSFIGQRNMKYATGNITPEKDNYQKIHSSISLEEKHQTNEGSVAYQPYKYEPNKQWHIAAIENRRNTDNVNIPLQQQPAQTHYAHPILDISEYQHKNMAYATTRTTQRNVFTEDRAKSVEHKPFDSMAPKLTYQTTHGDTQESQAREDKFSINDILSVRDNEQAKRMRENKLNSFPASISDPTKLDNQVFPGTSAIVEETAPKLDASKVSQDTSYLYKHENANAPYGYIRKDSYIQNEGFVNHGLVMKDNSIKPGIETFIHKENDKIIQKSLSYKERSQTKQEILTSKLKAHAQKEISAIKEKGLAKQGILSRNSVKQNAAVNSAKAQVIQEVLSPKKEITAEKLNHLFQDITYSSVTLHKDRDDAKYEPLTTEEFILPKGATWPQADVALSEKNNEAVKDDKLGKENTNVQPLPQGMLRQDENITAAGKKHSTSEVQNELTMMSTRATEPVNESIDCDPGPPVKHLTQSPAVKPLKKEASKEPVKTEEQMSSILPTTYSINANTAKEKEHLKNVGFDKPYTPTSYSSLEQVKTLDHSVKKEQEEQSSNAKVDKTTVYSVPTDTKHKDVAETTRPQVESPHYANQSSSAGKERPRKESSETKFGISAKQVKSPSEEAPSASSDNKTGPPTKYMTNSTKEEEKHLSRDASFNASGASTNTKTPETKGKEDLWLGANQDFKRQLDNTSKKPKNEEAVIQNSNSVIQKLQPKLFENADRNKEALPTPASIIQDNISNNKDTVMQKLQHVDASKAMPFENEDRIKGQHQTTESNKQDKISKNEDSSGQHLQHVDTLKTKSYEKEDRKKGNHETSELSKQDKISKNEDTSIQHLQHVDTPKAKSFEGRNKGQQQTSDSNKLEKISKNEDSVIKKIQHDDTLNVRSFENADKNKEKQQISDSNKLENISRNEDSVIQKNQHVDTPKVKAFENADRNKEKLQTSESNKQDKISKNEHSSVQQLQQDDAPKVKSFEKEDRNKGKHQTTGSKKEEKISKNKDTSIQQLQQVDTPKAKSFENADRNKGQLQIKSNKQDKLSKNEDSVIKKNQQVETPKVSSSENADKNKEKLKTSETHKQDKISKNEDSVLKKNQQVDTPKAKSFEKEDRNKEKHQTSDSNKLDKISKNEESTFQKHQQVHTPQAKSFEKEDRCKEKQQTSDSNKLEKVSKNEDYVIEKNQHVDTPKVKSFENADRNKEKQQTSDSNKLEKISKNEDSVIQKNQHVSAPKVKSFENADRNKGNHQTSETNKEEKLKSVSAEANGSFLLEELKHRAIDKPHSEKHKKEEIRDSKYPNSPLVKADKVTRSSDIQRQQDNDRPLSREKQIKNEKDFSEQDESLSKEMKPAKDKSKVTKNNSKPTDSIAEKPTEKPNSLNVPLNNAAEQMNNQTAQDKCSDFINLGAESKEESAPADEPVIYSICISSKSDVVSEDEPVIYTICVSSISDSSMTDGPVNQDTHNFGEKQLSSEGAEKEGETSGNKNEETETARLESKASDDEKARASFSSDKAEKETEKEAIRKYDSPATRDKQDYYRSSEVNNISSSYESLLAKYGLSIREKVHHKSAQKEPEKMQEKEKEEFTNNLPTKLPEKPSSSVSADAAERHCQESRKQKLPEETSELLKKGEEHGQNITQSQKHSDGLTLEAAGIMNTKDKKQLELQNEPDKQALSKSKVMKTCEDNQDTQLSIYSKQNKRNDSVELDKTKQVGQKVQTVDLARKIENKTKENENESVLSKKANTVLVENEKDHQKAEIRSTTVIGNHPSADTHLPKSKVSMSIKDNKASSSVVKEIAENDASNRVLKQDTKHVYKLQPSTPPILRRKAITETIKTKEPKIEFKMNKKGDCEGDVVKPEILTKERAPTKDDKALQNSQKELGVSKNELPVQEQAKFNTINSKTVNETKDRCETGINASGNKQTERSVQENCSVREDLHKNASTTVKADQNLFKAPNKLLEDPKVNKDQHKLNADISTVQDRRLDQQKQIKTDSMSARDMVLPKLPNSQSVTPQKVAGQKPQTITSPTESVVLSKLSNSQSVTPQKITEQKHRTITSPTESMVLPKLLNSQSVTPYKVAEQKTQTITSSTESGSEFRSQKNKGESIPRQKENIKDDKDNVKDNAYANVNRDNAKKAHPVKVEKATEGESNKNDSLKERTAQPQVRKDDTVTADKVRKDSGQTKSNVGAVVDKDSSHSIKEKTGNTGEGSQVKHDGHDRVNVYQYHPGKGFLPETKTNTYDEQNCIETNLHDMVPKKKEVISTQKSEAIQKEKKPNRPDISAIADYARLRVISVEDENASEKDLLEKLDTYRKYNSSSVEPEKSLQGNRPILGAEAKRDLTLYKSKENESQTAKPLQVHERERRSFQRSRVTEAVPEGHNQFTPREETVAQAKVFSQAKSSDNRIFAVEESGSTKDKALANQISSNTKIPATEQHYEYQRRHELHQSLVPQAKHTLVSKVEGKNDDANIIRQRVHSKLLDKESQNHVQNPESLPQTTMVSTKASHEENKQADNKVNALPVSPEMNDTDKGDELQYYIVSTMESEPKPSNDKISSKKDVPEIETTRPRSNVSSPAMGKPIMFKVKDNTMRTSSVTKTVKPRFHRSFSEELKVSTSKDVWSGLEKIEPDLEYHPKESANPANPQVLHEPVVVSHGLPRAREFQPQNSSSLTAARDARSYHRRSQGFEDEDSRSVISTLSEDVESIAGSSVVMGDSTGLHEMRSSRSTYDRPESSCYERPASSCYERPESACSDIRSMGKPPTVPPKSEKALRRAQKLTTRRIKKAEAKITTDSQEQLEISKPVRAFSSLPSSPMELISTNNAIQASPPIPHYHVDPNYAAPAPSLVAHPFPVTQRKLLQDPNSGQYFMVDMPVPHVKTKMFFDPETGKYVQLNVRQRTQSALSQPQSVEVLNHSYVVYPGFLPMSVSTLPTLRSSSQMSAPATLVEEPNKLEASRESGRQENCYNNNNAAYGSLEHSGYEEQSLYKQNNAKLTPKHTSIITMSELEDFAMEST
ncbi:uncharacterized protein LOC103038561 isoform X2 [Astyanax mexicanus]|uniref:uncharacterized protein LOC103038561 isoform X2 n=1 Tax=Astyanax mexicanus TaxID=7994 RepID=UPI0020CAD0F9|nr:uncharacterized protein LOC103038561 isoform X2 [Astyanax mexicanus]